MYKYIKNLARLSVFAYLACFLGTMPLFGNELGQVMLDKTVTGAKRIRKIKQILAKEGFTGIDAPIDKTGDTALHRAVFIFNLPLVKILFRAGADPFKHNYKGYNAFEEAKILRQQAMVDLFLGIDWKAPEDDLSKELISTVINKNMKKEDRLIKVKELIDKIIKADGEVKAINFPVNKMGETMLYWASSSGDDELIRVLLKAGADPHKRDVLGIAPQTARMVYSWQEEAKKQIEEYKRQEEAKKRQ